jgi:hypothetical protein
MNQREQSMNTSIVEPLLVTEPQAAKMLSISPSQLRKMRYRGEIQGVIFGQKCVRYAVEELRALTARAKGTGLSSAT